MGKYFLDTDKYAALARTAAAEGCVLLKNKDHALPLRKGDRVAVFGRIAHTYYKSGLGSGGLVNTRYVTGILDALRSEKDIVLNEKVLQIYEEWIGRHPYDEGAGWGQVPWAQEEMPFSEALADAADGADIALIVIGRTAGEDQDNQAKEGSYLLTATEHELIRAVSQRFARTAVLLNVGNIIDMKWVDESEPASVLYVWQGGQEGGNGIVDVLTGRVNPCGKLPDTIACDITDYPSTANFGDAVRNFYKEDIYVGYRYFETFAKEKVLYPFGFGLSYTTFSILGSLKETAEDSVTLDISVTNTGSIPGREVVQVYVKAPQGLLGKPERVLAGFEKTKTLSPGETQTITLTIPEYAFASYDDGGKTGYKSCYVLEEGTYEFFAGADVRSASCVGKTFKTFTVVQELTEALAPVIPFERIRPCMDGDRFSPVSEPVPLRTVSPQERLLTKLPSEIAFTGDLGYRLRDVYEKKIAMEPFVGQLNDTELMCLFRGEGMCSPKVTPGTASAFGGLTASLRAYGIPAACCSDGPSGIRMDCGTKAFSMPNGTLLGATFNLELVQNLYECTGLELRKNRIDTLLGPGLNLHRNPLNGRNFEYISEDPLLTGKMGAAQLRGMNRSGSTGTIKHFSTNNQETHRRNVDAAVSERALRELYLKCFEIAVKEGDCRSVMTTYGPLNGIWTAGNYDLNTTILRGEWGFSGIVMTDWWAAGNTEGEQGDVKNRSVMIAAQNDLFMVCADASDPGQDNVAEALSAGTVSRAMLQRNAVNILGFILKSPAMLYEMEKIDEEELNDRKALGDDDFSPEDLVYYTADETTDTVTISGKDWDTTKGSSIVFGICMPRMGLYDISFQMKSELGELAQLPVSVFYDNVLKMTVTVRGSEGAEITETRDLGGIFGSSHYIRLYFGANGLSVDKITISLREELERPF